MDNSVDERRAKREQQRATYRQLLADLRKADALLVKIMVHPDTTPEMIEELRAEIVPHRQRLKEIFPEIETKLGIDRGRFI